MISFLLRLQPGKFYDVVAVDRPLRRCDISPSVRSTPPFSLRLRINHEMHQSLASVENGDEIARFSRKMLQ